MPGFTGVPAVAQSVSGLKLFTTAIVPLQTAETTIADASGQSRILTVEVVNIDSSSRNLTLYFKPTAATAAADSNTKVKTWAIAADGIFSIELVVPPLYVVTGLASVADVLNAQAKGYIER